MTPSLIKKNLPFLFLITSVFLLSCFRINDPDSWIHLSFGRHMVEQLSPVRQEVFVYPNLGNEIVNPYWLFQIPLYLSYKLGGLAGVVIFKAVVISLVFFLFAKLLEEMGIGSKVFICIFSLLTALLSRFRFSERPEIFGYLFFILFLYILSKAYYRETGLIYLLPVVQAVWANSHQSASLGIMITAVFTAAIIFEKYISKSGEPYIKNQKLSKYFILSALVVAGYLMNPYSYKNLFSPVSLATDIVITQSIGEMQPVTADPSYLIPYVIVLVIAGASVLLNLGKVPSAWVVLFLIFAYTSYSVIRSLPFFFFTAMPIIAWTANGLFESQERFKKIYSAIVAGILTGVIVFTGIYGRFSFGFGEEKRFFASGAAEFLKEKGLDKKNIFNNFGWGGYVSWRLGEGRAFIDGRYGTGELSDDYDHIIAASPRWKELMRKYNIDAILINSIGMSDGMVYPLINALLSEKAWKPVYADSSSLVFVEGDKYASLQEIPYPMVLQEMIAEAEYLHAFGVKGQLTKTLGGLYLKKADYKKALYYYEQWLRKEPSDFSVRGVYEFLKSKGY